jgi:signal transduction histidine kinase
MHLLKNAIEAVDGTEKICINTCRQDRKVYIRIRDTGAGIPAAQLENLFDIGFNIQGGQVKMAFGWSAAYAIVRNHGGEIEVTSEVGKGTEVTVSMPIRTSDQA